jgi:branched-chain amino acid transport system substrate-binding protein
MKKSPGVFGSLFLSLASVVALAMGCGKTEAPVDIHIGLVAELTGDIPVVGASCKAGAEIAVAEINAAGGLEFGGKRHGVGLVIEDSKGRPDEAAAAVDRLVKQDGVLAIIGPNASLGAVPAAAAAEAAQVVLISPWSTVPKTTLDAAGAPKKFVFRACFTDAFQGSVLAKFASGYVHASKAAVLYDQASEAPKSQAETFKADFEAAGGKVVAFETYAPGTKDFGPQLQKIKAAAPDLVFLPAYYNDVPLQAQQARKAGITVPFLGGDTWNAADLLKTAGKNAEGAFVCAHYSPDAKNETTGRFVVSYKKRNGGAVPDDVAALTYDSFSVLTKAIAATGKLDRQAVRDALAKISDFEGVTGKMKFKGTGDPVKSAVMVQVKNGQFMFVTTMDP